MLWHNRLVLVPEILRQYASQFKYTAFISNSQDADPLAILTTSYSIGGVIRVSHNARHQALSRLIAHLRDKDDILIMTPDGPRGPRYKIKSGIVMASKYSGASIIPMTWSVSSFWQTSSWDKLIIPKPFSKIYYIFGDPIEFPTNLELSGSEKNTFLEKKLLEMDDISWSHMNVLPK